MKQREVGTCNALLIIRNSGSVTVGLATVQGRSTGTDEIIGEIELSPLEWKYNLYLGPPKLALYVSTAEETAVMPSSQPIPCCEMIDK